MKLQHFDALDDLAERKAKAAAIRAEIERLEGEAFHLEHELEWDAPKVYSAIRKDGRLPVGTPVEYYVWEDEPIDYSDPDWYFRDKKRKRNLNRYFGYIVESSQWNYKVARVPALHEPTKYRYYGSPQTDHVTHQNAHRAYV